MRVVYVAGRFRGPTAWVIENNIRRAEEVAFDVSKLGAMPLTPHCNTRFFHGEGDDKFWLDGTMELLRRCDAVILVQGWEQSSGTRAEKAEAERLGLPVFTSLSELDWWLKNVPSKVA
jgi:hypothetical protein